MSNILQGKEEYFTLIQKYSHYQSVGRMIEYNQIKGKGGERAVSEYVLELKGITKIFPGVKALNNVQFQLKPGEVHALMGEMEEFAGHMEVCNAIFAVNFANREAAKGGAV